MVCILLLLTWVVCYCSLLVWFSFVWFIVLMFNVFVFYICNLIWFAFTAWFVWLFCVVCCVYFDCFGLLIVFHYVGCGLLFSFLWFWCWIIRGVYFVLLVWLGCYLFWFDLILCCLFWFSLLVCLFVVFVVIACYLFCYLACCLLGFYGWLYLFFRFCV